MPFEYKIPDPLPWRTIVGPLATAEDALARLDQCLAKSPIRQGWSSRSHFIDAAACLGLEGGLVHFDDLVLHDAGMDVRTPTHDLARAHTVLRTRRRIADAKPDWALSEAGLASLRGRPAQAASKDIKQDKEDGAGDFDEFDTAQRDADAAYQLTAAFAAVDAAIAKTKQTLAEKKGAPVEPRPERSALVYDLDWDGDARFDAWRVVVERSQALPPTLAAAIAAEAWIAIQPLENAPGLGRLLAAALLRERGKARWHLPCLYAGLRAVPRERRRARDAATRLAVQLEAIAVAAESGVKDHDRWLTARTLLERKLDGRRSTSRLPALIDYVLASPIVSVGMIAKELKIAPRSAQDLVAQLGLREATGRGRYRAWGIF